MYNVDPPTVSLQGTRRTIEGETFSFTCLYKTGNPALTTVYWKKENSSNKYTGQTLRLPDVRRTYSGEYVCVAENTYSSGNKGSTNSTMILDVQCQLSSCVPFTCTSVLSYTEFFLKKRYLDLSEFLFEDFLLSVIGSINFVLQIIFNTY